MSTQLAALQEDLTMQSALKRVFQICRNHDTLKIGASDVVRSFYQGNGLKLVAMAGDLLEDYQKIILKKAEELNVPVVKVDSRSELGGLMPFSARSIGAVGVTDFVQESREKAFIFNPPQ